MKRLGLLGLSMVAAAQLQAAPAVNTVAVAPAPPALLTIIILACACVCAFFCFQVYSLVRGGQFSRCWLLFMGGFGVLALSQLGLLLSGFGIINMGQFIVPIMLVIMTGLFLYGLVETKRVLS